MSENFERGTPVDDFGFPPMKPSPNPTPELLTSRNQMQAMAMQRMLGLHPVARDWVTPQDMDRMVEWGHRYVDIFRRLFDTDNSFRRHVIDGHVEEVITALRAARSE